MTNLLEAIPALSSHSFASQWERIGRLMPLKKGWNHQCMIFYGHFHVALLYLTLQARGRLQNNYLELQSCSAYDVLLHVFSVLHESLKKAESIASGIYLTDKLQTFQGCNLDWRQMLMTEQQVDSTTKTLETQCSVQLLVLQFLGQVWMHNKNFNLSNLSNLRRGVAADTILHMIDKSWTKYTVMTIQAACKT